MTALLDRVRPGARPASDKAAAAPADDLVVVRRRLRHLAPLDIKPLPMMHAVAGRSDEPPLPEHSERNREIALYVLAIQMWLAAAKTALR